MNGRQWNSTLKARSRRMQSSAPKAKPMRPRRKSAAEKAAKFAREYHSDAFVQWIRVQPSVASGKGPCEAAHTENGGKGRKGGWESCVPLTRQEHRHELHQHGQQTFEAKYDIDLKACAGRTCAAFLAHLEAAT